MNTDNDKIKQRLQHVNMMLITAIKKLKAEISRRTELERIQIGKTKSSYKSLLSAIIFKDAQGVIHTVVKVKLHISSHFLDRCLNSQSMWELDYLADPTPEGYCRALANIRRDCNYCLQDLCNINNFETIVKLSWPHSHTHLTIVAEKLFMLLCHNVFSAMLSLLLLSLHHIIFCKYFVNNNKNINFAPALQRVRQGVAEYFRLR